MKFILLLLPAWAFCQNIPTKDGQTVHLDTIITVDSATKADIYSSAKLWAAEYFKSAKAVIDLDDSQAGTVVIKGNTKMEIEHPFGYLQTRCYYTIKFSIKDYRYKLEIYDLYYKPDNGEWVGNYYSPPPTTYPSTWFLPKIGKRSVKVCEQYRHQTIYIIKNIVTSSTKAIGKAPANESW